MGGQVNLTPCCFQLSVLCGLVKDYYFPPVLIRYN